MVTIRPLGSISDDVMEISYVMEEGQCLASVILREIKVNFF